MREGSEIQDEKSELDKLHGKGKKLLCSVFVFRVWFKIIKYHGSVDWSLYLPSKIGP